MKHTDELLELRCSGCGGSVRLDRRSPLVPGVRPFVEQHRGCAVPVDREMRSAYPRTA